MAPAIFLLENFILISRKENAIMVNKDEILYETKPATINALRWTGENHRDMFDFLTNYEKEDDYMHTIGDHFIIDHSIINGGLCLRTIAHPSELTPVCIGDYVIKMGEEFITMKASLFNRVFAHIQ